MKALRTLSSRTVVVPRANVDTDQIIPARFLRTTTREGLGKALFADWTDFPRDAPGEILVAGENFACGSSREHAPWALLDHGFRAVISSSIADIFRSNALKNGLLPVEVDRDTHALLLERSREVTLDVAEQSLQFDGRTAFFPLDPFARRCLLEGVDELGFLLGAEAEIAAFEERRR